MSDWHIEGEYMETCNCKLVCPCELTNLAGAPTEGDCKAAIAMKIDKGTRAGVALDGIVFVVLMRSPGPMAEGDIKAGVIIDDSADADQVEAITAIATGADGGPMGAVAPLVSEMAGVEQRPITFERDGMSYHVRAGELVDQALEGIPSVVAEGEPLYLENTAHPVVARLALANATHSRFRAFGIEWEDASGTRNGHFAPFSWSS